VNGGINEWHEWHELIHSFTHSLRLDNYLLV